MRCLFRSVAFYFVYTDRIRCAIIKNVRCFETADKSVSGILPHYYGWWEFNRTALAVSKFFVSLKLSIISLPESLPCCYTRANAPANAAEKEREMSWTKCGKKSSRQMWNIVKSEAVKLYNHICDFMRSAFVMFYAVLWLG